MIRSDLLISCFIRKIKLAHLGGIMILIFSESVNAQIKPAQIVGFNFSTIEMKINNESKETKGATGIHFGLLLPVTIAEHLSVSPGVMFSSKGASYTVDSVDIFISPIYLEVPVSLTLDIGTEVFGITLISGAYLSCGVGGNKIESHGAARDILFGSSDKKDMKTFDLGLKFGAGITVRGFMISARYALGMTNFYPVETDNISMKNRLLEISLTSSFSGR